jgi:hypothetical protein
MLNFNLADTQAGQDLIQMGEEKGIKESIIAALETKFGFITENLINQINQITDLRVLKYLHKEAIKIESLEGFKTKMTEALAQV